MILGSELEPPMQISDVCPHCKKTNRGVWVITQLSGKTLKVCKACKDKLDSGLDTNFHDKSKALVEKARKTKNDDIVRHLKITKNKV